MNEGKMSINCNNEDQNAPIASQPLFTSLMLFLSLFVNIIKSVIKAWFCILFQFYIHK